MDRKKEISDYWMDMEKNDEKRRQSFFYWLYKYNKWIKLIKGRLIIIIIIKVTTYRKKGERERREWLR